jgi:hypothetical protein
MLTRKHRYQPNVPISYVEQADTQGNPRKTVQQSVGYNGAGYLNTSTLRWRWLDIDSRQIACKTLEQASLSISKA